MEVIRAGVVPYGEAEAWQRELAEKRLAGAIPDSLLLLEHPSVVTSGRRKTEGGLRVTREFLAREGIGFAATDRGGALTYHGPGQLVGYFICALGRRTIPEFVREVEELAIRILASYGLTGDRDSEHPGVWVGQRKIASLGLHFERGISRHGFALNVNCDLKPFEYIVPCGIPDRSVTSMAQELGHPPAIEEIKRSATAAVQEF